MSDTMNDIRIKFEKDNASLLRGAERWGDKYKATMGVSNTRGISRNRLIKCNELWSECKKERK